MHRIDTPTAQADKFGPGKNGFTNGDPATGRRATDLNSDMWDAVQEEICAVIEKSGLALNKDQHDQLYQAIVKIITSKIPDALLKKNNLSDLADKALARDNLQLKTAAQKDIVTSKTDATADRVLTTGWMSLGGYGTDNLIAGADAKKSLRNGFYGVQSEQTYGNAAVISFGYDSGSQVHIIAAQGGQTPFLGVCGSTPQGAFGNWGKIYTEFQKPTAGDVDAVSASQGGTFQKQVIFNQGLNSRGKITWGDYTQAVGSSSYNAMVNVFDSTGKMRWAFGPYVNSWSMYAYNTDGSYKGLAFAVDHATFNATFGGGITAEREIISKYANGFRIAYGSFGVFWRNDGSSLYLMLTNSGDPLGNYNNLRPFVVNLTNGDVTINKLTLANYVSFDARYYTKAESEARYQPKGSYTPAGQAYTKAESESRFQKINTASLAANGWFRDTNTGMLIQYGKVAVTADGQSFTFPVAFSLVPTLALTVNGGAYGDVGASSISTTGFTVKASTKNTVGFIAIGK
ncbi:hypothetical protein MX989_14400 [Enterobacter sichuanensis]|uniref:Long-tail fiber proximal subunit trimerization domain-containing protein n=1 Tax=Enterobacter sichuanensis TaxID=2071710 RepID=A0AAE4IYZ4_9ENTR|nr:hypothetical protein [Enterobacter sichuanensis]MDR9947271.1 hypothetical protein [Enterobacter sichuanensis]